MKNINRDNYEPWALDYIENTLNSEDRRDFESFLNLNPDIAKELAEMDIIVLEPPQDIVYPHKEKLIKEETKIRPLYWWMSSVAAAVLALVIAYQSFQTDSASEIVNPTLTHTEKEKIQTPSIIDAVEEEVVKDLADNLNSEEQKPKMQKQTVERSVPVLKNIEVPASSINNEEIILAASSVLTTPQMDSESVETEAKFTRNPEAKSYTDQRRYSYSAVSTIAMASVMIQVPNREVVLNMNFREISPLPASKSNRPILFTGILPQTLDSRADIVQASKSLSNSLLPEIFTNH